MDGSFLASTPQFLRWLHRLHRCYVAESTSQSKTTFHRPCWPEPLAAFRWPSPRARDVFVGEKRARGFLRRHALFAEDRIYLWPFPGGFLSAFRRQTSSPVTLLGLAHENIRSYTHTKIMRLPLRILNRPCSQIANLHCPSSLPGSKGLNPVSL